MDPVFKRCSTWAQNLSLTTRFSTLCNATSHVKDMEVTEFLTLNIHIGVLLSF